MAIKISSLADRVIFTDTETNIDYPYKKRYVEDRYVDDKVWFRNLNNEIETFPFQVTNPYVFNKFLFTEVQNYAGEVLGTKEAVQEYLYYILCDDCETKEVNNALGMIQETYGHIVSVAAKSKSLLKFGRNTNVGSASTGYTIWATGIDQANETYVAANTNTIDSISSSSGSDTVTVTVEGHTETGGNKTFVTQNVTLNGQTRVALTTPLNRCTRVYNASATDLVGRVYVYENTAITSGKPNDTTKIHLSVPAGKNQSEKASTSLSSEDYWIITSFRGSLLEKTSAYADVELQVRLSGGVFRNIDDVACSSFSSSVFNFNPYHIVPPNSGIRLISFADGANTDVSGSIQGYLAKKL